MELTRRDAMAALAAAGVVVGVDALADSRKGEAGPGDRDHVRATQVAVAGVVYPSAVEGVESFVRDYADALARERPDHAEGVRAAVETLDRYAEEWYDAAFVGLEPATRDRLLDEMGADAADPDPAGADRERVRYYLVNDLLFALYASPTGGRLLGIENPPGHPGGTASYQRGPPDG